MYLELLERYKLRKMLWKSFLLFCFGMFLLTVSMTLKGNLGHLSGVMRDLIIEGLTVAAWVSLWSAFANLIFELAGIIGNIRIFRRIASREVVFKEREPAKIYQASVSSKTPMADMMGKPLPL